MCAGRRDWGCRLLLSITSWVARLSASKSPPAKWETNSFQGVVKHEYMSTCVTLTQSTAHRKCAGSGDYYCG